MKMRLVNSFLSTMEAFFFLQQHILFLCSLLGGSYASFGIPSFVEWGACPSVFTQKNFSWEKFSGVWFTQKATPNEYVKAQKCTNSNYTWNGKTMEVVLDGLTEEDERVNIYSNYALDRSAPEGRPQLLVQEEGMPDAPYIIYGTDYENFVCSFSCLDYYGFRALFLWAMTRDPNPPEAIVSKCGKISQKIGLSTTNMETVYQGEKCPYWLKYGYEAKQENVNQINDFEFQSERLMSQIAQDYNDASPRTSPLCSLALLPLLTLLSSTLNYLL